MKPVAYLPPPPTPPEPLILDDYVNTVNAKTVEFYDEACVQWQSIGEEGFLTLEEYNNGIFAEFANRGGEACIWSVTGFTPQGLLNLESQLNKQLYYRYQLEDGYLGLLEMLKLLTQQPEDKEPEEE